MAYLSMTWATVILEGEIQRYEPKVSKNGNNFGTGTLRVKKKNVKGQEVDPNNRSEFIQFSVFHATELEVFASWDQRYPPTQGQYGPRKQPITIAGVIEVKPASDKYPESEAIIVNHAGLLPEVLASIQADWFERTNKNAPASQAAYVPPQTYAGNPGARTQANQARKQYQSDPPPPSAGRPPYTPQAPTYAPPPAQAYGGEADPDYDPFAEE